MKNIVWIVSQSALILASILSGVYFATLFPELPNAMLKATGRNEKVIILPTIQPPTGTQEFKP